MAEALTEGFRATFSRARLTIDAERPGVLRSHLMLH
jgi:hypothetical protein